MRTQENPMQTVTIGTRIVGPGRQTYIIAEAGSNHDRNLSQALRLIDIAADAGADAVKFQTFRAEKIQARTAERASHLDRLMPGQKTVQDLLRELELPLEWHGALFEHSKTRGIDFLSTPFDEEAVDILDSLGVLAFKIASYELWHLPLIRHAARKGKPLLLSTGLARLGDVEEALEAVRETANESVVLLHCAIGFPPRWEDLNLRAITTEATAFGIPVGFSDHSPGVAAAVAAVTLGACVIEKHFTVDRSLPGPDHAFALEPVELTEMVRAIRNVEAALGTGEKRRAPSEDEYYRIARRSLFAAVRIPKGAVIERSMIAVLRPGTGLAPRYLDVVVGRRALQDIEANQPMTWDVI
jgi:sialic acid synthase SpsE